jgi:alcohol dehydrogenase
VKAVVLADVGSVVVKDVPEPLMLSEDDAIVRVAASAICGADLFPLHGMTPGFEPGTVMGHEFVGTVSEIGPAVRSVRAGQRVACTSTVSCGLCAHCRHGRPSQCASRALFGYSGVYPRLDGGQAERVRVPNAERCLWPLPDEVSDEAAVFLADILPTGLAAVGRGGVGIGDVVVILGCGPVGLMALLLVRGLAATVIGVDGVPERRRLAARLGAEAVAPGDAAEAVAAATGGLGADVVIEAAGTPAALGAALELVRGRGTVSVVGAHFEPDYPLDNARMFEREITLRFSIGDAATDRERLIRLVAAGGLDPTEIVSHRMPLSSAPEAYRLFDERKATKVVLQTRS